MEHIFTGYDHLAFLFGLLLVATSRGLRGGARYILGIVTAFTVAHSFTLIAAGLGWVRLPSRFVESAIALSIAYVAVENLAVREPKHRWLLTFFFGLVHGFGFASVLAEIGLPPSGVIPSLVSFNVGVELGQLTVVCAVAPILLWLVPRYQQSARVRTFGSIVLFVLSTYWFFERVLGKVWLHAGSAKEAHATRSPRFPVRDVRAALAHYRTLGFDAKEYFETDGGDAIYGFATRGGLECTSSARPTSIRRATRRARTSTSTTPTRSTPNGRPPASPGASGRPRRHPISPARVRYFDPDGNCCALARR